MLSTLPDWNWEEGSSGVHMGLLSFAFAKQKNKWENRNEASCAMLLVATA